MKNHQHVDFAGEEVVEIVPSIDDKDNISRLSGKVELPSQQAIRPWKSARYKIISTLDFKFSIKNVPWLLGLRYVLYSIWLGKE